MFDICKDTGLIQLRNVLPLEMTNMFPHNDAVGIVWESHNKLLLEFINKFKSKNVIELGGGSGKLATEYLKSNEKSKWTIYDKNYSGLSHKNLKIEQKWFDEKISLKQYDLLIHSHLFEHIHDPNTFLKNIRNKLNEKCIHVIRNKYGAFTVYQIAGFLVRRISPYDVVGQEAVSGKCMGLIHFGSRVDIIIPQRDRFKLQVAEGDYVSAEDTVLGYY